MGSVFETTSSISATHDFFYCGNVVILSAMKYATLFAVIAIVVYVLLALTQTSWFRNLGKATSSFDFVYTYDAAREWTSETSGPYIITDGKIAYVGSSTPALQIFDVRREEGRVLSFSDAEQLTLSPDPASPDGFIFVSRYVSCGDGAKCARVHLRHIASREERELPLPSREFIGTPHFAGWVVP